MIPEALRDSLSWAAKFDSFEFTKEFNLKPENGVYTYADGYCKCHPLETILVGKLAQPPVPDSEFELHVDVFAEQLGVSNDWVDGFCDGWNDLEPLDEDGDYFVGYKVAQSQELKKLLS